MSVAWNCEVNGEIVKPFKPLPSKIVTITIEEDGSQTFLKTDSADIFLECGEVITRRASHVEPANWALRFIFSLLRTLSADTSVVAAWTRTWRCLWRVNTKPVGGPILHESDYAGSWILTWRNRQDAIDAEIKFLNNFFAERETR